MALRRDSAAHSKEGIVVSETVEAAVREHPFTRGCRPDHIARLVSMAGEVHFAGNETIYREGDGSSFFYLILSGTVALEVPTPGRCIRIATLGHGEVLGWSSLLEANSKQFQARSLEEVEAIAFDGARLRHACEEDYAFGYTLMRALFHVVAERLQATRTQLLDSYSPIRSEATHA